MKLSIAFALFPLSVVTPSFAAEPGLAQVLKLQGDVQFDGQRLKPGQSLASPGILSAGPDSRASIKLIASGTEIRVTPGTKFKLDADSGELLQGTARWKVVPIKSLPAGKFRFIVKTRSAVMGVRGTDFMGVFNPLLGESEIVVFDGQVAFQSALDAKDEKLVSQGQWGGIGGRFRQKIGDLINLPENVLGAFQKMTEVP